MGFRRILRRLPGRVRGVIHVGAHVGQECGTYLRRGINRQVWIEPHGGTFQRLAAALPKSPEIRAFNVACDQADGFADLFCSPVDDGQSNSLMGSPGDHPGTSAMRVPVFTLDSLLARHGLDPADYDLLVLDVQGAEMRCLKGAGRLLTTLRAVVCEVQWGDGPVAGSPAPGEIASLLGASGYVPIFADWTEPEWGNVLFVREVALSGFGRLELKLWKALDARTLKLGPSAQ